MRKSVDSYEQTSIEGRRKTTMVLTLIVILEKVEPLSTIEKYY
jgi:hypothetical protein